MFKHWKSSNISYPHHSHIGAVYQNQLHCSCIYSDFKWYLDVDVAPYHPESGEYQLRFAYARRLFISWTTTKWHAANWLTWVLTMVKFVRTFSVRQFSAPGSIQASRFRWELGANFLIVRMKILKLGAPKCTTSSGERSPYVWSRFRVFECRDYEFEMNLWKVVPQEQIKVDRDCTSKGLMPLF